MKKAAIWSECFSTIPTISICSSALGSLLWYTWNALNAEPTISPTKKPHKKSPVFSHFPITVKVDGKTVLIENFQGERAARKTKIWGDTKVVPKGDDVIITGHVLTDVSQTAAEIENGSRVKNKDHRVFLDGVYKFEKKKGIEN